MHHAESPSKSDVWQIDGTLVALGIADLTGNVEVTRPENGIGSITVGDATVDGLVLGVVVENHASGPGETKVSALVRGHDLVVSYPESATRPFSWQVYWRASSHAKGVVVLDAIVSLQTELLESFPQLTATSQLAGDDVWLVDQRGETVRADPSGSQAAQTSAESSESAQCVLIRPTAANWSYAEMTAPEDREDWSLERSNGICRTRRKFGGDFLEKGVIRRVRIRGAFLPRQDDLALAGDCLRSLVAEQPPLTA